MPPEPEVDPLEGDQLEGDQSEPVESDPAEEEGPVLWRGLLLAAAVLVLVAIGLTVFAVVTHEDPPPRVAELYTFVIPDGTAARVARGDIPEGIFPDKLVLYVGDRIQITNQDSAQHVLATFTIRAGETLDYVFPQRGLYRGACTVRGEGHQAIIQVLV